MNEKLSLLTDLIKLARCDQQVREQENQVLAEMNKYANKVIPPDRLIELFRGQYN